MKYAISNIAWKTYENDIIYQLLQKKGFEGLEIAPGLFVKNKAPYDTDINVLIELKNEVEKKGITLVSMQSILYGTDGLYLFGNKELRNEMNKYIKKSIDFASVLGLNNIVFGSPKNRVVPKGMSYEKAEKISIEFFKKLGDYANEKDTCIGFEANALEYGGNWMVETLEAVELIKKVNSNGFKLNLDLGTMILNNEKEDILKEIFSYINHIHISEAFLKPVPQNVEIHKKIAEELNKLNYKRYISIEMKANNDNYENVKTALDFVKRVYQ